MGSKPSMPKSQPMADPEPPAPPPTMVDEGVQDASGQVRKRRPAGRSSTILTGLKPTGVQSSNTLLG